MPYTLTVTPSAPAEPRCFGAEDHLNRPACPGDDVRLCSFLPPSASTEPTSWHVTQWCADCRAAAEAQGYVVSILPNRPAL